MKSRFLAFAILFLNPLVSHALTFREVDLVCPIGGERFKQTLVGSGSSFGMYLDTRPWGPTVSPWPIPKCPENGFVMFSDSFTPEQLQKLEIFVRSEEYQKLARIETNYALAAFLMSKLGTDKSWIAYTFVQASWEAKTSSQFNRYIESALLNYIAALDKPYDNPNSWVNDQLIAGELERRLGRFEAAQSRFEALLLDIRAKNESFVHIINYQFELILKRDANPQLVPKPKK